MTALPTVEETWHNTFPTPMISDLPATDGRTDSSSRFDPQRIQKKHENDGNTRLESLDCEGRKIFWVSPTGGGGVAKGATVTSSYRMHVIFPECMQ